MGKQYRVMQKIGQVAITAGGFDSIDLPRDSDYEAVAFRISAQLQVTVLATSVRNEAPSQLVPRLQIVADGKNVLFNAPFWSICQGNYLRRGKDQSSGMTSPPSGVAVATYSVAATGIFDFATVDGMRPKDSNFRARGLSLFQATFNFGQAGDAFVGGTVAFTGSPIVEVFALKCVEETDETGAFVTSPMMLKKTSYQEVSLLATNPNQEIRLPAGNLVRSVLVRTEGATTAGEPDFLSLNNLTLQNGLDVRVNLSAPQIYGMNAQQYGKMNTGYYVADFVWQGQGGNNMLANLWDVSNAAEPKAVVDVTGGGNRKAQLVITEYIPRAA